MGELDFSRGRRLRIALYLALIGALVIGLRPWNVLAQAPADKKPAAAAPDPVKNAAVKDAAVKDAAAKDAEPGPSGKPRDALAEKRANEALAPASTMQKAEATAAVESTAPPMNLLEMFQKGGYLMYPILMMSVIAVAFAIDRGLGLRRGRIVPKALDSEFDALAAAPDGLDLRRSHRLCDEHPSPAANVVRAMLLKAGRPLLEIEQAIATASDREATLMYKNVRPLVLTVTVTPLMGLLGTVWGMIIAFYVTAKMPTGADKASALADGIYVKLLTTFFGLSVAIPALIVAHFYEGRILKRRGEIDDLVHKLLPLMERYEGKVVRSAAPKADESVLKIPPVVEQRRSMAPMAIPMPPGD